MLFLGTCFNLDAETLSFYMKENEPGKTFEQCRTTVKCIIDFTNKTICIESLEHDEIYYVKNIHFCNNQDQNKTKSNLFKGKGTWKGLDSTIDVFLDYHTWADEFGIGFYMSPNKQSYRYYRYNKLSQDEYKNILNIFKQ